MRIVETKVYRFAELDDKAKERARQWYREVDADDPYFSEAVIEDAARMADLLGIDLRTRPVRLMNGTTRYDPCVFWSGFYHQGSGASFEGSYSYRKGSAAGVAKEAPGDYPANVEIRRIAQTLSDAQRAHRYNLTATVRSDRDINVRVEIDSDACPQSCDGTAHEAVKQATRDFADWIYRNLETEYEYRNSDEQVDESIEANEYEFTESGERA